MKIKKEHRLAIQKLSDNNKKRILNVLLELRENSEVAPRNYSPYGSPSYLNIENEETRTILLKLTELGVIWAEYDNEAREFLFIDVDIEAISEAIELLKSPSKNNISFLVEFDDKKAAILIGKIYIQLPPHKDEHYFCRVMFKHEKNKPIDWSEIYEEVTGSYEKYYGKPSDIRENWRPIYDTLHRVNKRVKEQVGTDVELFTWQEKTVRRNL